MYISYIYTKVDFPFPTVATQQDTIESHPSAHFAFADSRGSKFRSRRYTDKRKTIRAGARHTTVRGVCAGSLGAYWALATRRLRLQPCATMCNVCNQVQPIGCSVTDGYLLLPL